MPPRRSVIGSFFPRALALAALVCTITIQYTCGADTNWTAHIQS